MIFIFQYYDIGWLWPIYAWTKSTVKNEFNLIQFYSFCFSLLFFSLFKLVCFVPMRRLFGYVCVVRVFFSTSLLYPPTYINILHRFYWKIYYQLMWRSISCERIDPMTYTTNDIHALRLCLLQYQITRNSMMRPMLINKGWNVCGCLMKLFAISIRYEQVHVFILLIWCSC